MATQQDEFLINFFQVVVCHCVLSHLVALIRKSPAQGRAFLLGKYLEMGRREDKKGGMPSPAPVPADTHLQLTGGEMDQWVASKSASCPLNCFRVDFRSPGIEKVGDKPWVVSFWFFGCLKFSAPLW